MRGGAPGRHDAEGGVRTQLSAADADAIAQAGGAPSPAAMNDTVSRTIAR